MVYVTGEAHLCQLSRHTALYIKQRVSASKHATLHLFKKHCGKVLFNLKYHILYHMQDNIIIYVSLDYIDASFSEQLNVSINN